MIDLLSSVNIAASGMKVQGERIKIISQNIANADSAGEKPGEAPYRRKTIAFGSYFDNDANLEMVKVKKVGSDKTPFKLMYNPGHPAANDDGYVQMPNVETMMEMVDMREAQRSYEANLNMIDTSKGMLFSTINLLIK